jgi:hypothetical protein
MATSGMSLGFSAAGRGFRESAPNPPSASPPFFISPPEAAPPSSASPRLSPLAQLALDLRADQVVVLLVDQLLKPYFILRADHAFVPLRER